MTISPQKMSAVPELPVAGKISVVIPTYNNAHFLPEALDSVFAQTFGDVEIIVVNDGSTDNTREVVRAYGRTLIYVEQENSGPARARNKGVSFARGEYVAFLDADDVWMPDKLEQQMGVFSLNQNAALVYSQVVEFDEVSRRESPPRPRQVYSGSLFDRLLIEGLIPLPSVIIKKSVIREVGGFDEGLFTAEDTNLWIKVARKNEIVGIDKPLVRRRLHSGNISARLDINVGTLENLDRIVHLFPETAPYRYLPMKKAYINRGMRLVQDYFHESHYERCHATCRKLASILPFEKRVLLFWLVTLLPPSVIDRLRKIRQPFWGSSSLTHNRPPSL